MGSLVTFRKLFNYGLQFGLSPDNVKNLGFICIILRVNFQGVGSDRFRGGGNGEEVWGKRGSVVRIRMGKLRA